MKVLLSLDPELVSRLDAEARARGVSRSALVANLTATALGLGRGLGVRPEVRAALARTDALFRQFERGELPGGWHLDSTDAVRADRDAR